MIPKRQWGAFYGTELDLQMRRRGLTTIVLCGVATEFGVESTACDADERGYAQVFVEDAMTGLNAESHVNSVARILPRIGQVGLTVEVIAALLEKRCPEPRVDSLTNGSAKARGRTRKAQTG